MSSKSPAGDLEPNVSRKSVSRFYNGKAWRSVMEARTCSSRMKDLCQKPEGSALELRSDAEGKDQSSLRENRSHLHDSKDTSPLIVRTVKFISGKPM